MTFNLSNALDRSGNPLRLSVQAGRFAAPDLSTKGSGLDVGGATILPGFVDAHCHIIPMGLDMQKLHLGPCQNKSDVLDAIRTWASEDTGGWIQAVHYDQTKFEDATHLTRDELDSAVSDRPVLLRHSNGHASVANTAALAAANIAPDVPDPTGGTFVRDGGGRLTGVLLERAHEFVTAAAPVPTTAQMVDAVMRAGERMASLGITCASDMMTGRWNLAQELEAYTLAAKKGCAVRLRLYAQWATLMGPKRIDPGKLAELTSAMDPETCRLNGLKIFADGAIGSATAAIYGEFLTTGGNGQLIYAPDRFKDMVRKGDEAGWSIAVHTIGDRSTDLVMDAFQQTQDPRRHRVEHAMLLSDAQIDRLAGLGSPVTFQPEFLVRFGHAYQKQLGPERARSTKRCRSVLRAGIDLSFSSDRPIVPGDPWDGIKAACHRPEGFDPAENIDLSTALTLYSESSARANNDSGDMGVLSTGALADFQIYDGEPGPDTLRAVYKGGHETFRRGSLEGDQSPA